MAHTGGHGCKCNAVRATDAETPPRLVWKPLLPQHQFDPLLACKLLGSQRLLLIGDSTIEQAASTIMNALSPAGCQGQVWFAPGDTLIGKMLGVSNCLLAHKHTTATACHHHDTTTESTTTTTSREY